MYRLPHSIEEAIAEKTGNDTAEDEDASGWQLVSSRKHARR